jgi:hypothetical protein
MSEKHQTVRAQAEQIERLREQNRVFFDVVYFAQSVVGNWERGMSPDHVSWSAALLALQEKVKVALEAATAPAPGWKEVSARIIQFVSDLAEADSEICEPTVSERARSLRDEITAPGGLEQRRAAEPE